MAGIVTHGLLRRARYPLLDTRGYDVFIAQTPYPGHVCPGTRLIVRYHDAVPLLQSHTVRRPGFDRAAHRLALRCNAAAGAWFACVSEATRARLLALHPEVRGRAVTVHNLISGAYHEEARAMDEVPAVLRRRAAACLPSAADLGSPTTEPYILMVATLEPRKNHATLLDAWLRLRQSVAPDLRLVLVGDLGWQSEGLLQRLRPVVAEGAAHLLERVPADELRLLYRHARATVCPSLEEGFGYAGIEAMRCGGLVVASDLPAHREVYQDAAAYYSPNTVDALADVLTRLLDPQAAAERSRRIGLAPGVTARYMPDALVQRWQQVLAAVCESQKQRCARTAS